MDDVTNALEFFHKAIQYSIDNKDKYAETTALINLGAQQKRMNRLAEAEDTYRKARGGLVTWLPVGACLKWNHVMSYILN